MLWHKLCHASSCSCQLCLDRQRCCHLQLNLTGTYRGGSDRTSGVGMQTLLPSSVLQRPSNQGLQTGDWDASYGHPGGTRARGSPRVVCQHGMGQEEDRALWDATREETDSKNAVSRHCPLGTAAKKDFSPLYGIVPGSSCHSVASASSVWPWWTVMNATGSNLPSPPYKRMARAFSPMDKKKPLLKMTKLCFSSKSQPGASQPIEKGVRGLTSVRGLPDTPMAAEKCSASWAMLLGDLGAMGTHSVSLFIQTPGRSLVVG